MQGRPTVDSHHRATDGVWAAAGPTDPAGLRALLRVRFHHRRARWRGLGGARHRGLATHASRLATRALTSEPDPAVRLPAALQPRLTSASSRLPRIARLSSAEPRSSCRVGSRSRRGGDRSPRPSVKLRCGATGRETKLAGPELGRCRVGGSAVVHVLASDGVEVSVAVCAISPLGATSHAFSLEPSGLERALLSDVLYVGMRLNPVGSGVAKEQLSQLALRQSPDPLPTSRRPKPDTDHRAPRSRVRPPVVPMPGDIARQPARVVKDRRGHRRAWRPRPEIIKRGITTSQKRQVS